MYFIYHPFSFLLLFNRMLIAILMLYWLQAPKYPYVILLLDSLKNILPSTHKIYLPASQLAIATGIPYQPFLSFLLDISCFSLFPLKIFTISSKFLYFFFLLFLFDFFFHFFFRFDFFRPQIPPTLTLVQ